MSSALSLFYDPVWIKKHYDNMPKPLKDECSKNVTSWNKDTPISSKVWTAYLRHPEYLEKYITSGRYGETKKLIPKQMIEYYDWIYAPLIEIKPDLEKKLKRALFMKNLSEGDEEDGVDKYYWNLHKMHSGGADRVKEMPNQYSYQARCLNMLLKDTYDISQEDKDVVLKTLAHFEMIDVYGKDTKFEDKDIPKSIINLLMIPPIPQTQTGWYKKMYVNKNGYIPLFIYDFNNSNDKFLNWVTNPFA